MNAPVSEPKPRFCHNWLNGLVATTQAVGEWELNASYWPRLATLAFANAKMLQIHLPECLEAEFLPPPSATDRLAMDFFRSALVEGLRTSPQPLPGALREGLCHGLGELPRAFRPRAAENDSELLGRWLTQLGLRLGLEQAPLTDDFHDRMVATFKQTPFPVDQFLVTRLTVWRGSKVEDVASFDPVHDLVRWYHQDSEAELRIMPWVIAQFEELGTGHQPTWHPDRWLNAGWKAAPLLTSIEGYRAIFDTAPVENVRLTHRLYRELAPTLSSTPQFDEVATGALQYFREFGYDRRGPGHNAYLCIRAFDYSLWMRLAHEGLVPMPRETADKA